jgi:hypothetical protein
MQRSVSQGQSTDVDVTAEKMPHRISYSGQGVKLMKRWDIDEKKSLIIDQKIETALYLDMYITST